MVSTRTSGALAQVVFPAVSWRRDALLVVGFSLFIALSARVSIPLPFTPVPITLQTLAVLLTGATLGWRLGALSLGLYLVVGSLGAPFFAGGQGGAFWLLSSGGYLLSYIPASALVGMLAQRGWDRGPRVVAAMALGNVVIYAIGLPWLALFIAASPELQAVIPGGDVVTKTLTAGLLPFLIGDAVKLALASAVLPGAWKLIGRGKN
ncbi:MAG: biotin transporter BioY [Chloroflexi bacterium]|nr:biotin transporter BioY [Chloroflexota bacterium]